MQNYSMKRGARVRFSSAALHASSPEYYPAPGTVGMYEGGGWVQWPKGATSGDDRWHAPETALDTVAFRVRRRAAGKAFMTVGARPDLRKLSLRRTWKCAAKASA